jgi:hypothetical protein
VQTSAALDRDLDLAMRRKEAAGMSEPFRGTPIAASVMQAMLAACGFDRSGERNALVNRGPSYGTACSERRL